jgi:hypothetical protein
MFEQPLTIPKDNRFPSGREAFIKVAALLGQAKQAGRACSAISDFPSPVLARRLQPSQLDTKCWAGREAKQARETGSRASWILSSVIRVFDGGQGRERHISECADVLGWGICFWQQPPFLLREFWNRHKSQSSSMNGLMCQV